MEGGTRTKVGQLKHFISYSDHKVQIKTLFFFLSRMCECVWVFCICYIDVGGGQLWRRENTKTKSYQSQCYYHAISNVYVIKHVDTLIFSLSYTIQKRSLFNLLFNFFFQCFLSHISIYVVCAFPFIPIPSIYNLGFHNSLNAKRKKNKKIIIRIDDGRMNKMLNRKKPRTKNSISEIEKKKNTKTETEKNDSNKKMLLNGNLRFVLWWIMLWKYFNFISVIAVQVVTLLSLQMTILFFYTINYIVTCT